MRQRRYAVIAGGGTAGHVFVALALAGAMVEQGVRPQDIELVGSSRGQDASLLGREGYPLTVLAGRGIVRKLGVRALGANLLALSGLLLATVSSLSLLVRRRPRVLVSVGGYAAVPAGLAAAALRIPVVLVNIDAIPGAAHRLLGRFAVASAVAFAQSTLPAAVVTGAPVRSDLVGLSATESARTEARRTLGLPEDRWTIALFGGSLGARRLNDAALELAERNRGRQDLTLYHVSGARNFDAVRARAQKAGLHDRLEETGLCYRLVSFEENMAALYRAADLAVCRAGALSVAELTVVGVPAILVPLPGAPGDHQSANASALVEAGAAVVVADQECDGARIDEIVGALLAQPERLVAMGKAAGALGHPDAAAEVAKLVASHAR